MAGHALSSPVGRFDFVDERNVSCISGVGSHGRYNNGDAVSEFFFRDINHIAPSLPDTAVGGLGVGWVGGSPSTHIDAV